jgi:hypothetical protein
VIARPDRFRGRGSRSRQRDPVEFLEARELLSTLTITSPRGAGIGSLGHAIIESHQGSAPSTIDFHVEAASGLGRRSIPAITSAAIIHSASARSTDQAPPIRYYNADSVTIQPVSSWTGIRNGKKPGQYLITGTSTSQGLLNVGPISGRPGKSYYVNFPGASVTSVYGPDLAGGSVLRLVGTYSTSNSSAVHGFVFQGTTADLSNRAHYRTIDYPHAAYTYIHSTMGDLAAGNGGDIPAQTDHAFLYSLSKRQVLTDVVYPGSSTMGTSVYGIWFNGRTSYTLAGGYDTVGSAGNEAARGYLVDYNEATGKFSHWTSFAGPSGISDSALATHFQGISSSTAGVYTMAAATTAAGSSTIFGASLAVVRRNRNGTFGPAAWVSLNYPDAVGVQSANSVAGNQIVGIATTTSGTISYQATVNSHMPRP